MWHDSFKLIAEYALGFPLLVIGVMSVLDRSVRHRR